MRRAPARILVASIVASLVASSAVLVGCAGRGPAVTPGMPPAPVPAPRVTPGSLLAAPLLGELPAQATRLGAGPLAIVAAGPMSEGERLGAFVEVPKDACLLAYGRASPSLEDIDLAAFADEGNPLALDEGPDPKPTVMLCPPHPDRVYVAAHAAAGAGLCVIGAQLVPHARAAVLGRTVGARGTMTKSVEAWPGLDDRVRAHRAALGGVWEEQRRQAVPVDPRLPSMVAFSIDEGGCTDALVVPDSDVAMLDVEVVDEESRLIARARETSSARSVTVCSTLSIGGTLRIRPHIGRGLVAVVTSKATADTVRDMSSRPDVAWAAPKVTLEQARTARNAALSKAGYGPPTSTHGGQLRLGRRITTPIDLFGATCARVDVVAGAPLALLDAAMWDDGGSLLATGDGVDGATMFACGKGKARVDLATQGRPGPYAVLVRPERWTDPAFAAHPLAAGRMLSRATTGVPPLHEGSALSVRHASIDAAHESVHNTTIEAGRCLGVAVGAQGEGTGLELRLFDVTDGEEIDRSHGQHSAAVHACATDATRTVRVELRATSGKLDAIVGERVTTGR